MDAVADPSVTSVVVPKASQVGWTEIINNVAAFYIARDPSPILVVQPTLEMGKAWSKDRFAPMLRDTPALHGKVQDPRSRDSGNTLLHKIFPGGHITIVGANSPASLASRPIRVVLADEVDRYPVSAGSEGDPLKLAAKRQTTFWNRKTLLGSTPTLKNLSVIWREWERSDKRRFMVPCLHCGHAQHLSWERVHWSKDKNEAGETIAHHAHTAHYSCERCGALWTDVERWAAIRNGRWQATAEFTGIAGFHVPGFLSPWLTLEQIVREFLDAKNRPELLQVWVNTVLGEPWEDKGETVSVSGLMGRGEAYDRDSLPDEVLAVTAGVDTQDDRLEVQLIGWGAEQESWPFEFAVLPGDPAQPQVWKDLDALLLERFTTQAGRVLRVRAACVDSGGHHAGQVQAFCRARAGRRIFATKGVPGPKPIWPTRGSRTKTNDVVFMVGVDTAKDAVYGRLRIARKATEQGEPQPTAGYVHFPALDEFDQAYFDQLTSEQVVTRYREGRPYRVWVLPKGRRNEALDTFVLALAARMSLPRRLGAELEYATRAPRPMAEEPAVVQPQAQAAPEPRLPPTARPAPRNWLTPQRGWLR